MSNPAELNPSEGRRRYILLSLAWLFLVFVGSRLLATEPPIFAALSTLVFSVPVALSGGYSSAANQIRTLSYYKEGGKAHRFFSRRCFVTLVWIIAAPVTTFLMLLQFATYTDIEWVALGFSIPVYWVSHTTLFRFFSGELKKRYEITRVTITWARLLSPLVALCVYGFFLWLFDGVATYESLSAALAAKRTGLPDQAGSQMVFIALQISTFVDGFKSYAVGPFAHIESHLPHLITALGAYFVFFNACTTFSCFAIPTHELRRVIGPLSEEDIPSPISGQRIFYASAIVTFVALFIYLHAFAWTETWLRGHPMILEAIGALENKVENIDGAIYAPGTIAKIEVAKAVTLGKLNVSRATMEGQISRAFDRMEQNVDGYLDWYYSLTSEYVRLAKLLTGQIEGYMEQKLSEHLQKGEAYKILADSLTTAASTSKAVMDEYRGTVDEILTANRLDDEIKQTFVVRTMSMKEIYSTPVHLDAVALTARVSGGAIGASVGAGIGAAVTAKVVSKGVFKAAAKAVAELVAKKAAGAAMGLIVGGVAGSVIPAAGTVVGGAIGGLIGGVVVDAALLRLEESISREVFKQEIVIAIRDAREELNTKLFAHR